MSVAGLILAAGESRRMGFPKALLVYHKDTFLATLIGLFDACCSPVIVVLGAEAERIRRETNRPATYVTNPDYQRGMTTSLQCGLRAVPASTDGLLFTLVDHPSVLPSTLTALLALPRPLVRVPRFGGKRGHPIWFSSELIPEFLAIPDGGAANAVVRGHAAATEFLDLDDPGITADIDDPEAYRDLIGERA